MYVAMATAVAYGLYITFKQGNSFQMLLLTRDERLLADLCSLWNCIHIRFTEK